jgi:hypothetical protein
MRLSILILSGILTAAPVVAQTSHDEGEPAGTRGAGLSFGLGIGVALERRITSDAKTSDTTGIAVLPRFIGRGLGPAFDFTPFDVGVVTSLHEISRELGVIRVKPVMLGIMWQQPVATKLLAEIQFLAGYSFDAVSEPESKPLKMHVALPQSVTSVADSFAWQPRLALWYDIGSRVGLMVAGRYLHTRPRLTFADASQREWKADRFTIEAGVAFTVVKPPWRHHSPDHR